MDLIIWNEHQQKWSDTGNDYWCGFDSYRGKWYVSARYGFDDGVDENVRYFPDLVTAMHFFVNFLFTRYRKFAENP